MKEPTLQVWPSEFLLPSFDAKCLQFMACAKFAKVPIKFESACSPWRSPNGSYPVLKEDDVFVCTDFRKFVDFVKKFSQCDDFDDATEEGFAEMEALKALTDVHLRPAYLYMLWLNEFNYPAIVEPWAYETLGLVYSCFYARKMKRQVRAFMHRCFGKFAHIKDIEADIMEHAKKGLNILSDVLASKKYFFGDKPTSADAFVFGYLAAMLYAPLPDDRIQQFIRNNCANLNSFVLNILSVYLPLSEEEQEIHRTRMGIWDTYRSQHRSRWQNSVNSEETKYPLWEKIAFGATVVVLTVAFAVGCGVIQVRVKRISANA